MNEESVKAVNKNINMLTRKIMALEYIYSGMLSKLVVEARLKEYAKIKKDKKAGLNEAEYFMLSGYVSALEWVLSGTKTDPAMQKESMYRIEHVFK